MLGESVNGECNISIDDTNSIFRKGNFDLGYYSFEIFIDFYFYFFLFWFLILVFVNLKSTQFVFVFHFWNSVSFWFIF